MCCVRDSELRTLQWQKGREEVIKHEDKGPDETCMWWEVSLGRHPNTELFTMCPKQHQGFKLFKSAFPLFSQHRLCILIFCGIRLQCCSVTCENAVCCRGIQPHETGVAELTSSLQTEWGCGDSRSLKKVSHPCMQNSRPLFSSSLPRLQKIQCFYLLT